MAVSWERIDRKLAILQALLIDLAEDLALLRAQQAQRSEAEAVERDDKGITVKIGRKMEKGEVVEMA